MGSDDPLLRCSSQLCASPGILDTLLLSRVQTRRGTAYRSEMQSSLILTDIKNTKAWKGDDFSLADPGWVCLDKLILFMFSLYFDGRKGSIICVKQFSFCYLDMFLFRGSSTTCRKEKTAQCKDGNKEGKVDELGSSGSSRDTWRSGPVSVCVTSLCNTEGLFLKSELCPPPAFLGNGYNGAIQKRISLPRPGRGNKNQGMEGRKGQFVVSECLYRLEMNHEADIAPAVAYVSTALYNELHLVVAGISWHFLWSSYGSLHTLGLEWCSILCTKVNIEAIHKNGSKARANWCSGSGVYLGLGTSVLVPVRLVCARVPLMVGSQVAA